jgi:hypothetical protein
VNTQGISNNQDSWMQFVKLTQEARKRNSYVQELNSKNNVQQKQTIKAHNIFGQNQKISFVKSNSINDSEPKLHTKILGGLFDTYV